MVEGVGSSGFRVQGLGFWFSWCLNRVLVMFRAHGVYCSGLRVVSAKPP